MAAPTVRADTPAVRADAPTVRADTPAGRADAPAGRADTPAGRADTPAGRADTPAGRADTPTVCVALVRQSATYASASVRLAANGVASAGSVTAPIAAGSWRVRMDGDDVFLCDAANDAVARGPEIRIASDDPKEILTLHADERGRASRYRGDIVFRADRSGRLRVFNIVGIEDYLRGVVSEEMPEEAPSAALCAQAIASRTLALRRSREGRGTTLRDTTDTQVYAGVDAERPTTDAAVRATAGLILVRDRRLVEAEFGDDCGGTTAPGDDAADFPPSIADADGPGMTESCALGPHHRWTLSLSLDQIASRLRPEWRSRIGRLVDLQVTERDVSGRARRVECTGDAGNVVINGADLRRALGVARLRSTLFTVDRMADDRMEFAGRGNGHGRGLCQWGAIGQARTNPAVTYQRILDRYYPGAQLVSWIDLSGPSPRPSPGASGEERSVGAR